MVVLHQKVCGEDYFISFLKIEMKFGAHDQLGV